MDFRAWGGKVRGRGRELETGEETERQTDRQTERKRDRETHREVYLLGSTPLTITKITTINSLSSSKLLD